MPCFLPSGDWMLNEKRGELLEKLSHTQKQFDRQEKKIGVT